MKSKIGLIITAATVFVVALVVSIIWIKAFNGLKSKTNEVEEKRGQVEATLGTRYDKMDAFIDALTFADSTVEGYLSIIREGRTAFADAIASGNPVDSDSLEQIDGTLVTMLLYMEDNPASYQINGLISGYLSEISATNNVVLNSILAYNSAVREYNNHIETFPNLIFVGSAERFENYPVLNYNKELPSFN